MPEGRLAIVGAMAAGEWRARPIAEAVTLFVEEGEVVVRLADGEELSRPLEEITGAEWRSDRLTLHVHAEALQLHGAPQLERAWVTVSSRACAVPELTRGLRSMGGRHAGDRAGELHSRFFAPFLQARRRLESDEPIDWRASAVDPRDLAERLRALMSTAAGERLPDRPAHRRALEAHLLEAVEPLLAALDRVAEGRAQLHEAPEATRFLAWRAWSGTLRRMFADADRSWAAVRLTLDERADSLE